jgi:hypothetical protein
MPTDDDYRQALAWWGRLSAIPVSIDTVRDFFAWKREAMRGDAFLAVYDMSPRERAALSASLIIRSV